MQEVSLGSEKCREKERKEEKKKKPILGSF